LENKLNYTIGVYAEDYLLLLELLVKLNEALPIAEVKVCGGEELVQSLPAEVAEQIAQDPNELKGTDLVILLGRLPDEFFKDYDGQVIALSGFEPKCDDLMVLKDPLTEYLYLLAERNKAMAMNIGLPMAIYGKAGVDMLMQETRSVYSFEQYDDSVLPMRIAFNMHFYANDLPAGVLSDDLAALRRLANVNVRINPISTVFVVDLFAPAAIKFPEGLEFVAIDNDFSLEEVTRDAVVARIASNDGRAVTLTGDYLHLRTFQILNAIKEALL
jgi:hypothetical protein